MLPDPVPEQRRGAGELEGAATSLGAGAEGHHPISLLDEGQALRVRLTFSLKRVGL